MTSQLEAVDSVDADASIITESAARSLYEAEEKVATEDACTPQLSIMIDNLQEKAQLILDRVSLIKRLSDKNDFKVLSKTTRNNLLHGLQDEIDTLEEISKVAVRSLKKVKRERISESKVDELLDIPEYIRNSGSEEGQSDQ